MGRLVSHREAGERYLALRIVGGTFTVLGSLLLVGSCVLLATGLYALWASGAGPLQPGTAPVVAHSTGPGSVFARIGGTVWVLWSLGLLVSGLQSFAIGALIRLAIHLEENTRVAAQCLMQLRTRTEPAEHVAGSMFVS